MGENKKSSNAKRISLFTASGLMMVSALLFWLCDIGTIPAICLATAGFCFFAIGLNTAKEKKD